MNVEISPQDLARFYSKIKFNKETWCWDWVGTTLQRGYGHFSIKRKIWRSHRLSFAIHKGELIEGLTLDHLCRNRACCNPEHLEQVTSKVNILRGESVSAKNAKKTHCPQGHEYDEQNTYVSPTNGRSCRKCFAISHYKSYHKDIEKSRATMRRRGKEYRQKYPERIKEYKRKEYQRRKKKLNTTTIH